MPFEKSRSYIGMFVFLGLLGIGSVAAYSYFGKIKDINKTTERVGTRGNNIWSSRDESLRKEFQQKQKRALEALEKHKKAGESEARPRTQDKSSAEDDSPDGARS